MVLPRTEVVEIGRSHFGCLYRQEYFLVYIKFLIVWVAGLVTSSQWFPKFDKFLLYEEVRRLCAAAGCSLINI